MITSKNASMNHKQLIIIYLILFSVVTSCTKEEDPADAPGKGSITGKVRLADEFGVIAPKHGEVTATTQTGKNGLTTDNGSYLIYGLKDGTFDLTISKYGYGSYKRFGIPVSNYANTELTGIDTIGKVSTSIISALSVALNPVDSTWTFNCNVSPVPDVDHPRGIRLFFSNSPGVNSSDYDYSPSSKWMATTGNGAINGFTAADFLSNGFSKGDTVYVIAYGESFYSNVYTDPATQKKIYPNVNVEHPSNVAMFILN